MKDAEHKRIVKERQLEKHFHNPLDPLVLRLSKDYINDEDLTSRLAELFKVMVSMPCAQEQAILIPPEGHRAGRTFGKRNHAG